MRQVKRYHLGNIKGATGAISRGFWTHAAETVEAEINLDGIVAVIGHRGLAGQASVSGRGHIMTDCRAAAGHCNDMSEGLIQAGSAAIKDFVVNSVNTAKMNVMENKLKSASARP